MKLWHRRLAHLLPLALRSLIEGLNDLDPFGMCDVCLQAQHKETVIQPTQPFKLVHSDTCGPFSILTPGCHVQYILFVDDCTRYTPVYLLPDKTEEICIAADQYYHVVFAMGPVL
jgi:hypothetical protein